MSYSLPPEQHRSAPPIAGVTAAEPMVTAPPLRDAVDRALRWMPGRGRSVRTGEQMLLEAYRLFDLATAISVLGSTLIISNLDRMPQGVSDFLSVRLTVKNLLFLIGYMVVWRSIFTMVGLYDLDRVRHDRWELFRVLAACALGSAVALIFPLISESDAFRLETIAYYWVVTSAMTVSLRSVLRVLIDHGRPLTSDVIIVGSGPRAAGLHTMLGRHTEGRYNVLGFIDSNYDSLTEAVKSRLLGTLDELEGILMRQVVDEVLIALPVRSRYEDIQRTIEICERAGVRVQYLADTFRVSVARPSYDHSEQLPVVTMHMVTQDYRLAIKRCLDIIGAVIALILLSPVMIGAGIAVKVTSPGPVFFLQERYGRHKRRIKMYKFRTMVADAEALLPSLEASNEAKGPIFKMLHDPRLTPVGRRLRQWSIDELPQLWNVLRGEMSLVGPRPMSLRDVGKFTELALMRRFSVTPGMTGLWQVSGRSNLTFDQWIALDLAYIDGWSLGLDMKILARTPLVVLLTEGAA